jgi:hypothetical protein
MATLPLTALSREFNPSPGTGTSPLVGKTASPRLSPLEWSIVAMAEHDGLSSIREESRYVRAIRRFFGFTRPNPLANERLEVLRRIAVLAWHYRWNVPKSELAQFLAAGFNSDQYELVQNSIGQARITRSRKRAR